MGMVHGPWAKIWSFLPWGTDPKSIPKSVAFDNGKPLFFWGTHETRPNGHLHSQQVQWQPTSAHSIRRPGDKFDPDFHGGTLQNVPMKAPASEGPSSHKRISGHWKFRLQAANHWSFESSLWKVLEFMFSHQIAGFLAHVWWVFLVRASGQSTVIYSAVCEALP